MFKLMQRYLASTFIPPFLMGTTFFVSFLLTFQLFRVIRLLSDKTVSLTLILELIMHISVSFIPIAVPIAALFATIFTLSKMSDDSEIVAMRSFGVTKLQITYPFLTVGIVIAAVVFSLNRSLIPQSKARFNEIIMKLTSRGVLSNIVEDNFYTEIPGIILFAEKVTKKNNIMHNLFINQKTSINERTIMAKRGVLIKQSVGEWAIPTVRLHLNNGNVVTYKSNGDVEKIRFEEYDFPVMSESSKIDFVTKDSMRSSSSLLTVIKENKKILKDHKAQKIVNQGFVKGYIKSIAKSEIEYWSRINTPIQTLIFILLGLCLGIKRKRGKAQNTTSVGMAVLFSYYLIFFLGMSLAKKALIPAFLVVFVPTVLVLGTGVILFRKLDWAS